MRISAMGSLIILFLGLAPWAAAETAPPYVLQWGTRGGNDGQFSEPRGVACSTDGYVYVADAQNARVQKFDVQGRFIARWGAPGSGPGQMALPYGVAVDPEGFVYVADRGNNRIQKFTASGQFVMQWGGFGAGAGQMSEPYAVAVDGNGNVYVADEGNRRIQRFSTAGQYVGEWRVEGFPLGVAVDRHGDVYVTAAYEGRGVIKYSPTGDVLQTWQPQDSYLYGIAVDGAGAVYVGRFAENRIAKFGVDGALAVEWGGAGTNPGQFGFPTGIAAAGGLLFVTESENHRVQVFRIQESQHIEASAPSGVVAPNTPIVNVPVLIRRELATPTLGYSVRLHLSGLTLSGGGVTGITEATFLSSSNPSTVFQVIDNGGGSYTIDNVSLGAPCGATALNGTLFNVAVTSTAPSGPGYVIIDEAKVFDCNNVPMSYAVGAPAPVSIDNTLPVVGLSGPNGGEISPQQVTWSATDNVRMGPVDLALSVDGGATFPFVIATGLPNTGSYEWTPPAVRTTQARVRITAHDVNGNIASDVSDADFTLGLYRLQVNVGHGSVARMPDLPAYDDQIEIQLTATPDPGYHFVRWAGGVVSTDNPIAMALSANTTLTAEMEVNPPVAAIAGLAAVRAVNGTDCDGTLKIQLSWPTVAAGQSVQVYRAGFGGYPQFDGAGGSAPLVPAYPPTSPWVLTDVTASGEYDKTASRDAYYYVAFVMDQYGTISPVSNMTAGVLNYLLGDFSDEVTAGRGDNQVGGADVSLMGFHYGASGAALAGYEYLDVGPTTDRSVLGRPITDGRINIEDLLILGLNFGVTATPSAKLQPFVGSGPDLVSLRLGDSEGPIVIGNIDVRGSGAAQAISVLLGWDDSVVTPEGCEAGQWLTEQAGVALSGSPGSVDAMLLGARPRGLSGVGELATIRFRRIKPGDPAIVLRSAMGRNVLNQDVPVALQTTVGLGAHGSVLTTVLPNPFKSTTSMSFSLARTGNALLEVYSIDGRRVRLLRQGSLDAGEHRFEWDGRDDQGHAVNAGVYFAQLRTEMGTERRRMVKLK